MSEIERAVEAEVGRYVRMLTDTMIAAQGGFYGPIPFEKVFELAMDRFLKGEGKQETWIVKEQNMQPQPAPKPQRVLPRRTSKAKATAPRRRKPAGTRKQRAAAK